MGTVKALNPGRIYQARLAAKLTQDALAHRLNDRGIKASARYINRWEKGVNAPRADVIPALADALGVSIDELFSDEDDEESDPVDALMVALRRVLSDRKVSA